MPKKGRPRALNETKRREICALVSAGAGIHRAAQYVGCSQSTINREAQRDEEFREQLRRAKATTQLAPLQAMRQAVQTNWRAAAWMLERSDPEQFGRRYRNAFGAKELRALARDLMAIFDTEIDNPIQRERVSERVQATINYAMRHAWDTQRSGNALRQAMDFFTPNFTQENFTPENFTEEKPTPPDPWETTDFNLGSLAAELAEAIPKKEQEMARKGFDKEKGTDNAKQPGFCNAPYEATPKNHTPKGETKTQNP